MLLAYTGRLLPALLLCACGLSAQVFPDLGKRAVDKAIRDAETKAGATSAPEPDPEPVIPETPPAPKTPTHEEYKAFFAAAIDPKNLEKERARAKKVCADAMKNLRPEIKTFFKGKYEVVLEEFSDASRTLKSVKYPEQANPKDTDQRLAQEIRYLQQGGAQMESVVADFWSEFTLKVKNAEAMQKKCEQAAKTLERGAEALEKLADTDPYKANDNDLQWRATKLRERKDSSPPEWMKLYNSYSEAAAEPWTAEKVFGFAYEAMSAETPLYIHAREVLKYAIEKFPDFRDVVDGRAVNFLGYNYIKTYDFQLVSELITKYSSLEDPEAERQLTEVKRMLDDRQRELKESFSIDRNK